jgi:hypothetical protein
MEKHRLLVVGAGRIGAGFKDWPDLSYTHAGAARALPDRVELAGFVDLTPMESDGTYHEDREYKFDWVTDTWKVACYSSDQRNKERIIEETQYDILSICTPAENHAEDLVKWMHPGLKGCWMEKPLEAVGEGSMPLPIQVNYLRRADEFHRELAKMPHNKLVVYGKDDETTRCHFRDLSRWWKVPLDYRPFNGPCAYALDSVFFDNGGISPGECMKGMLGNLLDAVEGKAELWSPPYAE